MSPNLATGTKLYICNAELDVEAKNMTLHATIPSSLVSATGETIIRIVVPQVSSAYEQDSTTSDRRKKGLLVSSIDVAAIKKENWILWLPFASRKAG
ncbi:hypothetical protein ACYFX5_20505 [Bremerella sp. T1]|uniref:hypothetical protein n=1 Tax=Bremerella sp. TYQ1 TaxID=3119568 RepID=UPI001CCABFAD|nr:hypothetical protein [Bremerella volcania]UBM35424.1 hypothetical protein LA756_22445 [Bremerella volcania]